MSLPRHDYRTSIPRKSTKKDAHDDAKMEHVSRYASNNDARNPSISYDNMPNSGYERMQVEHKNASANAAVDYRSRESRDETRATAYNADRARVKGHDSAPSSRKSPFAYNAPQWLRADSQAKKLDFVSPSIRGSKPVPAWLKKVDLKQQQSALDYSPIERKSADYRHRDRDFDAYDAKRNADEPDADFRSGVDYRHRAVAGSSSSFQDNRAHRQTHLRSRSRSRSRSPSPLPIRRSQSSFEREYRDYDSRRPLSPVRSRYAAPPSRSLDGLSAYKYRTEENRYESRKYEPSRRYSPDRRYSPIRRRERSYEKRCSNDGSSSDEDDHRKAKNWQLSHNSRDSPRNRISDSRERGEEYDAKRLFLAVNLPDHIRFCLASLLVEQIPDCNPIADEDYHMTLNFIPKCSVDKVDRAIRNIRFPSFDIQLQTPSAFPSLDHPRVVVVLADFSQKLIELQKEISHALKQNCIKHDTKQFNPHVTIARIPGKDAVERNKATVNMFLDENKVFYSPAFEVEEFALMESLPESASGKYRAIRHYKLMRMEDEEATR